MSPKAAAFLLGLLIATTGAQDSLSPQRLTDLVREYITQMSTYAEETLRQAQQSDISKHVMDQIQNHLQSINPYNQEVQEKITLYIGQLQAQMREEGEKIKEKLKMELEQLQTDMAPFVVDVQNQVTTTAENLKIQLVPYTQQLQITADALATQIGQKLMPLMQELQARVKENMGDPATLSPYLQNLQQTINEQVADIKMQLGPFPAELKAKVDQAVEELYKGLSPYAQTTPEQLRKQVEELSFQVEKSAEALREKLQEEAEQLQRQLDMLLQGDLASHLDSLNTDIGQKIEDFRQQVTSYGVSFNTLVVENVQKLGQRLQPQASGVEQHLSSMETYIKEKMMAFMESLRQTEKQLLPALEEA